MRARTLLYYIAVVVAVFAAQSCGSGQRRAAMSFYEFRHVEAQAWRCTDTLRFAPDTALLATDNALSVSVRLGQQFAYRDLWLVCEQRSGHTVRPQRDTLHFILADNRGRWHTSGVVLHEASLDVRDVHVEKDKPLEFLVYHIMREQEIRGVYDVGLCLNAIAWVGDGNH